MAQKELTEAEIRENIRREFERWDDISVNGCSDPYWEDGMNMRLVRNHILYWYRILWERGFTVQDFFGNYPDEKTVPPEVPYSYMVKDGRNADRLKRNHTQEQLDRVVWGYSGEYATQSKARSRKRNRT